MGASVSSPAAARQDLPPVTGALCGMPKVSIQWLYQAAELDTSCVRRLLLRALPTKWLLFSVWNVVQC